MRNLGAGVASARQATVSPVLSVEGLVKRREQGGVAFELHVPRFSLRRASFAALVGDSGCGKSTLLDILALVLRPSRCNGFCFDPKGDHPIDVKALWESGDEAGLARLRRDYLGYVLQTGGLLPFLTVEQNLCLPPRIKGLGDTREAIKAMAERIGLGTLLRKKPQFLSGGQRQRVAVLRALAHGPKIVLADEPTAAVDKKRARAIVADLHALAAEKGCNIVMVTHDQDLVAPVADVTFSFQVTQESESLTRSVCLEGSWSGRPV